MNGALSDARRQALHSASRWYAVLSSEGVTPQQQARWLRWHQQDEDHRWAWRQVENLRRQMGQLPGNLAGQALRDAQLSRRRVLKGLALLLAVGGGWRLWRSETAEGWRADYHTAKGELLRRTLADGTSLALNTDSAVDLLFDAEQRLIRLWYGEIAIITGRQRELRPFRVVTRQGILTALGTEFTVRQQGESSSLSVQRDAVAVALTEAPGQQRVVAEGQSLRFHADRFGDIRPLNTAESSWTQGILSFSDASLATVIASFSRYRPGVLRCDPAVAQLRLSGAFPLPDIDAALQAITHILPVKIQSITNYWLTIVAA